MDDYLSKPVSIDALEEVLDRFLCRGSPPDAEARKGKGGERPQTEQEGRVWDRKDLLDRVSGDEDGVREIVDVFLSDIPHQIESLREAIAVADLPRLRRGAHSVKAAAGNLGAEALAVAAARLEEIGALGRQEYLGAGLEHLETQFDRLKRKIEAGRT